MDEAQKISVIAPSRLHFGLLSFNNPDVAQFGGVGMMLKQPGLQLSFEHSETFTVSGPHAERVRQFARTWQTHHRLDALPHCAIKIIRSAPQHVGLGLGTQLGLGTAAGLSTLAFGQSFSAVELAASVGRGKRSGIGTYGFELGGFLFEKGKREREIISGLERRLDMPERWRVVLIRPQAEEGLSGSLEQAEFDKLPPVPTRITQKLLGIVNDWMIPAIETTDFEAFCSAVTDYGEIAGRCFESSQGGAYASPMLQRIVDTLRQNKVKGVGQSSWGPTLFALAMSAESADQLVAEFHAAAPDLLADICISEVDNSGATVTARIDSL